MSPVTTIVHFEMPAAHADEFLDFWQTSIKHRVNRQPGLIGGIFYRGIDPDGPFQFINVARWESVAELEAALPTAAKELHQEEGVDLRQVFHDLGVTSSQNNYVEEVHYSPAG